MATLSVLFLGIYALSTVSFVACDSQNGARRPADLCTGTNPGFGADFDSLQVVFCPDAEPHCQRFQNTPVEYTFSFTTKTDVKFLQLVASYMEGSTETILSRWSSSLGWKRDTHVVIQHSLSFAEGTPSGNVIAEKIKCLQSTNTNTSPVHFNDHLQKTVKLLLSSPSVSGLDLEICRSTTIEAIPIPFNFQKQGNKVGDMCPKESVGGPCIFENSVCDLNLAGTSGECRLGAGQVDPEVPPPATNDGIKFGDYCYIFNAPCAFAGSMCVPSPSPYLGFCECNKGFTYEERTRDGQDLSGCKAGPQFSCGRNEDCVSGAHCVVQNSAGGCTCWPGFFEVESQCIRLGGKKVGDACNVNGAQCNFPYSTCSAGSCGCNPVAIEQYGKCKVPHKRQCISNGDCVGFANCVDGTCRCIEGKDEVEDGTCAGTALVVPPLLVLAGLMIKFFVA